MEPDLVEIVSGSWRRRIHATDPGLAPVAAAEPQ